MIYFVTLFNIVVQKLLYLFQVTICFLCFLLIPIQHMGPVPSLVIIYITLVICGFSLFLNLANNAALLAVAVFSLLSFFNLLNRCLRYRRVDLNCRFLSHIYLKCTHLHMWLFSSLFKEYL